MYKMVGLWFILMVCLLVVGYGVFLLVANGPRETSLMLYPWQEGSLRGIWVLLVVMGLGVVLVPLVRLLVRTIRGLREARRRGEEPFPGRSDSEEGLGEG
ncbi:MAG: hypothetical protein WBD63_11595 [Phycisphaerae bacterium]|nr:hypothetical protein [Phycisphaerae bacterium]